MWKSIKKRFGACLSMPGRTSCVASNYSDFELPDNDVLVEVTQVMQPVCSTLTTLDITGKQFSNGFKFFLNSYADIMTFQNLAFLENLNFNNKSLTYEADSWYWFISNSEVLSILYPSHGNSTTHITITILLISGSTTIFKTLEFLVSESVVGSGEQVVWNEYYA